MWRKNQRHLASAVPGGFMVVPPAAAIAPLRADYDAMGGMMFADPPAFSWVLDMLGQAQEMLNEPPPT